MRSFRRWLAYLIWPECREIGRANQVLVGKCAEYRIAISQTKWWLEVVEDERNSGTRVRQHAVVAHQVLCGVTE